MAVRDGEAVTREDLIEELQALKGAADPEAAHARADALLIMFIDDDEVKEAFKAVPRWYA